jgi:hypothetical protein
VRESVMAWETPSAKVSEMGLATASVRALETA